MGTNRGRKAMQLMVDKHGDRMVNGLTIKATSSVIATLTGGFARRSLATSRCLWQFGKSAGFAVKST